MRGDSAKAVATLQARFKSVVEANPWLVGTLAKRKGKLNLVFNNQKPTDEQVAKLFNPTIRLGKKKKPIIIHSRMNFYDQCKAISGSAAEIAKGSSCIGNSEPQVAMTVVPDSNRATDTFAVIFSLSHVIADGFTYYKLLAMISSSGTITSLNPKRKHEIEEQSKAAMGIKEKAWIATGSVIYNVITGMLCGKKAWFESYLLDPVRVEKEKAQPGPGVEFVSTNDVLVSTFGNAVNPRVLLMPINYRDKLPAFTAQDAGNYEGALLFGPEDYASAGKIRKTLQTGPPEYLRGGGGGVIPRSLPGCCETMRCRIGLCTSWVFSFFQELDIEGCEQLLHTAYLDVNAVPFDLAVIYRPKAGQTAVAFFVRSAGQDQIRAECPVGEVVPCPEGVSAASGAV
jgi:hypothetical protein